MPRAVTSYAVPRKDDSFKIWYLNCTDFTLTAWNAFLVGYDIVPRLHDVGYQCPFLALHRLRIYSYLVPECGLS